MIFTVDAEKFFGPIFSLLIIIGICWWLSSISHFIITIVVFVVVEILFFTFSKIIMEKKDNIAKQEIGVVDVQ